MRGRAVLELGCNVGATAIVLGALGAEVTAVDPSAAFVELARANAARHGLSARIAFHHVADTRRLPFESGRFDWVCCNSVLEYVAPKPCTACSGSSTRVLRPGGIAAILGTSNRLWPREDHTGRWLVNYLPRWADRLTGKRRMRGVSAFQVRGALRGYDDLTRARGGRLYVALKARMGVTGNKLLALAAASRVLAAAGVSPGALGPTMTLVLRKR